MKKLLFGLTLMIAVPPAAAQTLPAAPVAPGVTPAGPAAPLSAEARETLKILQDRKNTLKDFTGKIDLSTEDARTGDTTGKRGTVNVLIDPSRGPTFSADFTLNTEGGRAKQQYRVEFIFDGRDFTIKDWGINGNVKQYVRNALLPPDAKPGDAATLSGAMPLPIGLDVDDVARNFEVTAVPSKNPDQSIVKLVPRDKKRFDYSELLITLDKKQQLPVKLEQKVSSGDVTTILLQDLEINAGKARLADAAVPAAEGWTKRN